MTVLITHIYIQSWLALCFNWIIIQFWRSRCLTVSLPYCSACPSCPPTGLTLCHRETEGIHRAGGQDSASRIGQRWQDHPAEKPRLWGCEHYHANAGERKLCVQKAVCIRSITLEHMVIIVFSSPCLNQFNFNINSRCSLLYVYQVFHQYFVNKQFTIKALLNTKCNVINVIKCN